MLVWGVRPTLRAGDGLAANYYDNPTLTGVPVYSGVDPTPSTALIGRRWGDTVPPAFSVDWTGYLTVGRPGVYNFATTSDDGSRLYVDGQLVVDNGGSHSVETRSQRLQLARGPHRVRLEYVQFGGDFQMAWSWAGEDGRYGPVPSWALSRRRAGYATVLAARIVDLSRWGFAILTVLAATWYLNAWLGLANALAVAFVVAGAVPFDPIVSTGYYEYQIHLTFVRRLQWGVDVVSTYGPWGFVGLPLFHPATFRWMLLVNTLVLAITACRVFVFVQRIRPPGDLMPGLWTAVVLLPLTVIPVAEWSPVLFCFHVIAIAISVEWFLGKGTKFAPMDAISAFALGFLALVKVSAWSIAPVLIVASWFQSRRHSFAFTTCFMFGALSAWLAARQSLMHLSSFLRLGLDVIGGFKNGLALWDPSDRVAILFLAAAVTPLAVLLLRFSRRPSGRWLALLVPGAVFGQLFQAAFVRADTQHIVSNVLGMCAVTPLFVAAALSDRKWRSVLPAAAIVTTAMLLFQAAPGSPNYSRPQNERRSLLALLSDGSSVLDATRERLLAQLRASYPLPPQPTTAMGAILSGDIGILEANSAVFSLQPTISSFAAYTRRLEELNTSWLERRPVGWVLWCGKATADWRYPTEAGSQALVYLATHFQYRSQVGNCALLDRVSGSEWSSESTDLRQLGFDQVLPIDAVDGSIVWAEIAVRETFLGKIVRMFLKPAPVTLYAFEKDGTTFGRDIMPSMTRQGFLLSPVVMESWDPLAAIADGRGTGQQLVGLRVGAWSLGRFSSELFYRPEVTVRMTTLHSPRSLR